MSDIKVAIVGTGGIANTHAVALADLRDRARLVAVADVDEPRAQEFARKFDVSAAYGDVLAMLREQQPDLVHVCTPPSTHRDLVISALQAGASVLCEKPLCGSLSDLDQIEEAQFQTGKWCAGVFQWRFGSGGQHLKKQIAAQSLGRILVGICQTTWYRDHAYYAVPWRGKWSTELGGPTMGHGIHAMDFFLWLMGEWQEVGAMIGTLDRDIAVEDVSLANVRFKSGAMGSVINSVLSPRQETYLRFDFQQASIELTGLYGYSNENWRYTMVSQDGAGELATPPSDVPSSHKAQIEAVLDALERNEPLPVTTQEIRPTLEFLTCLYKAASLGKTVQQGSVVPGDPFYEHVGGTFAVGATAR